METDAKIKAVETALNEAAKLPDGRLRPSVPASFVRRVVGAALSDLSPAYSFPGLSDSERNALDRARVALENWYAKLPSSGEVVMADYLKNRPLISRIYIEYAGAATSTKARTSNTLGDALRAAVADLPNTLEKATQRGAEALKSTLNFGADLTSGVLAGLLKGLWPVLLVAGVILLGYHLLKRKGVL